MRNWERLIPYLSLGFASTVVFLTSQLTSNRELRSISLSVFSSSVFFFLAYLFYDVAKRIVIRRERKFLVDYIKNRISNDVFVALYFLKKIIHGYNLDTNTLKNIYDMVNYSANE